MELLDALITFLLVLVLIVAALWGPVIPLREKPASKFPGTQTDSFVSVAPELERTGAADPFLFGADATCCNEIPIMTGLAADSNHPDAVDLDYSEVGHEINAIEAKSQFRRELAAKHSLAGQARTASGALLGMTRS